MREQPAQFFADSVCKYLALKFMSGDLGDSEALASLQGFGGEVMSALAAPASNH